MVEYATLRTPISSSHIVVARYILSVPFPCQPTVICYSSLSRSPSQEACALSKENAGIIEDIVEQTGDGKDPPGDGAELYGRKGT